MRRTFGFDVLRCPKCQRRMRVLATITPDPVAVALAAYVPGPVS
jgi:hypothetical protein